MEYDRALYRVYEKTVEDLLHSRRTTTTTNNSNNANGSSSGGGTGAPRHSPHRRDAAEESNDNDISTILSASSFNYEQPTVQSNDSRNGSGDRGNNSNGHSNTNDNSMNTSTSTNKYSIPFLLPHCLTPCPSSLSGAIITGNWRMMFYFIRYNLVNRNCRNRDRDHARDDNDVNDEHESAGLAPTLTSPLSSSSLRRMTTNLEMTELTITDSSSNLSVSSPLSSSGLRRRPNSPRHTTGTVALTSDEETGGVDYSSEDSSSNTSSINMNMAPLSPPRESSNHSTGSNNMTVTPSTQLARTVALNQQERNSNSTSSNNANSNNSHDAHQQNEGCSQTGMILLMRTSMFFAFLHLFILFALHHTYVGPRVSKHIPLQGPQEYNRLLGSSLNKATGGVLDNFINKSKNIKMTCLERALSTRQPKERSQFYNRYGDLDRITFVENMNMGTSMALTREKPLLGRDEVLQVKIIYGSDSKCSNSNANSDSESVAGESGCSRVRNVHAQQEKEKKRHLITEMNQVVEAIFGEESEVDTDFENNDDDPYGDKYYSSAEYWQTPHYRFSIDEAFLYHSEEMLAWMNVSFVNVTLSEKCLSTGSDVNGKYTPLSKIAEFLSIVYSTDTILMNQFMYGIKTPDGEYRNGHVQNMRSLERWSYTSFVLALEEEVNDNLLLRMVNKVGILCISIICFFFISSVTALIVRILTSSGVLILFPFFQIIRSLGMSVDDRVLDYAHPWLGYARRRISSRGLHSLSHFAYAHLARLVLIYAMYEACQATWSTVFYSKSVPVDLPLWIFASALVWEYFSLIYCRSALSAYFYPRYTMLLFVAYHIYFYTVPYGFFRLALIPYVLFMVHNIIFTLLALEVPASSRGAISIECPREVYSQLSWSEWSANLPSEWTLFLPLNSRYIPLHDRNNEDDNLGSEATNGSLNGDSSPEIV